MMLGDFQSAVRVNGVAEERELTLNCVITDLRVHTVHTHSISLLIKYFGIEWGGRGGGGEQGGPVFVLCGRVSEQQAHQNMHLTSGFDKHARFLFFFFI